MLSSQALVVGGTIAGAASVVAQSAANDGFTAETGWSAGMIAGGVAVFVYLDRRAGKREADIAAERRRDDDRNRARTAELEAEVARLNERIIALLTDAAFGRDPRDRKDPS